MISPAGQTTSEETNMEIKREGSMRNHGSETVVPEYDDTYEYNPDTKKFVCRRGHLAIGSSKSYHAYQMELSLTEFCRLLDLVATDVFRNSRDDLSGLLATRVGKLHLLTLCGLGYPHPEDI